MVNPHRCFHLFGRLDLSSGLCIYSLVASVSAGKLAVYLSHSYYRLEFGDLCLLKLRRTKIILTKTIKIYFVWFGFIAIINLSQHNYAFTQTLVSGHIPLCLFLLMWLKTPPSNTTLFECIASFCNTEESCCISEMIQMSGFPICQQILVKR